MCLLPSPGNLPLRAGHAMELVLSPYESMDVVISIGYV